MTSLTGTGTTLVSGDIDRLGAPRPAAAPAIEVRGLTKGQFTAATSRTRTIVFLVATLLSGTLAGFFLTYAFTIMPGLETTDDRTFVEAFQGLERMFGSFDYGYNWPVMFGFLGGPLVIAVAIALDWKYRPIVWWIVAALVLTIATIVITQTVNVPLNNEIKAAGDPNLTEAVHVRADFRETWWRAWNLVRSATSVGAFMCVSWAFFLHGKRQSNLSSHRQRRGTAVDSGPVPV
jgi:uncharacterized membrane protein